MASMLRHSFQIPQRMLVVGLPLIILLGFGMGVLVFDGVGMVITYELLMYLVGGALQLPRTHGVLPAKDYASV